MVSLLRSGPSLLMVASARPADIAAQLVQHYDGQEMAMQQVFDRSDGHHTVVFVVDSTVGESFQGTVSFEEVKHVVLVPLDAVTLLCDLLNCLVEGDTMWPLTAVRPAPQTVVLRVLGDPAAALELIQRDYGGERSSFTSCMEVGTGDSLVLGLTNHPIHRSTSLSDFYPEFLHFRGVEKERAKSLQMSAFRYVSSGLEHSDWSEVEIRIYDLYSAYQLHYDRMVAVFDALEVGLIIGEAWSKDYPRFMMSVEVYSVHVYTSLSPKVIKSILFGLEHLTDGRRIVDFDVFVKGKKLYWRQSLADKSQRTRPEAAIQARKTLYEQLSGTTIERLNALELKVLEGIVEC